MENIIYTDADLNAFLVANEEQTGNTIAIVIECDATADQELTITAGGASTTESLTPGTKNSVEIPLMLWNFGDDTVITLSKSGTDAGTVTIHFPAAVDSDAAINETETDNEFTLQGSASVQEQIVSLQESVERVSAQTLAYILPSDVDQSSIADGGSNTVETFEFEAGEENVKIAFFTCVQFLATTTITAENAYEDLNLTITISVDGVATATILQTHRDGRQVMTINHLIENLSKGNHTMNVDIAAAGGSVSVMQIVAAYMLTAKSTNEGSISEKTLMSNGTWAAGTLFDGLNQDALTEEAYTAGVESAQIKYSRASIGGSTPPISTLSQWFNTKYILLNGAYFSEEFYKVPDGYYRKAGTHGRVTSDTGKPIAETNTAFYIPIKRVTGFSRLRVEAKMVQNNGKELGSLDYNYLFFGAAAVVNGDMIEANSLPPVAPTEWTTYTIDISALPYVDYIVLHGTDGSPGYRNIILLK